MTYIHKKNTIYSGRSEWAIAMHINVDKSQRHNLSEISKFQKNAYSTIPTIYLKTCKTTVYVLRMHTWQGKG